MVSQKRETVSCPICGAIVFLAYINKHLDKGCSREYILKGDPNISVHEESDNDIDIKKQSRSDHEAILKKEEPIPRSQEDKDITPSFSSVDFIEIDDKDIEINSKNNETPSTITQNKKENLDISKPPLMLGTNILSNNSSSDKVSKQGSFPSLGSLSPKDNEGIAFSSTQSPSNLRHSKSDQGKKLFSLLSGRPGKQPEKKRNAYDAKESTLLKKHRSNYSSQPISPKQSMGTPSKIKRDDFAPLAEKLRPQTLNDYIGQRHIVGPGGILSGFIKRDQIPSLILWGPPGVGKTTIARIIANSTRSRFVELSATSAGVQECRKIFEESKNNLKLTGKKTILFCDEIHRFNKSQQDIFLPYVEKGDIILIGATTENPSFQLNNALLSRCRVFVLNKLSISELSNILKHGIKEINRRRELIGKPILSFDDMSINYMADISDGDSRSLLNLLEICEAHFNNQPQKQQQNDTNKKEIIASINVIKNIFKRTHMIYDRVGDSHYDTISAFHKSVRGSDANAALFYLAKMLAGGESPLYVARRMIRIASEDVGIADETCLPFAVSTYQSVQMIGMPEVDVILAHCCIKLARAKKSVLVYRAFNKVKALLRKEPGAASAPIPLHLRNAPTKLMKDLDYGKQYKYNPDYLEGIVKQNYLPEKLGKVNFLDEKDLGDEHDGDLSYNQYEYLLRRRGEERKRLGGSELMKEKFIPPSNGYSNGNGMSSSNKSKFNNNNKHINQSSDIKRDFDQLPDINYETDDLEVDTPEIDSQLLSQATPKRTIGNINLNSNNYKQLQSNVTSDIKSIAKKHLGEPKISTDTNHPIRSSSLVMDENISFCSDGLESILQDSDVKPNSQNLTQNQNLQLGQMQNNTKSTADYGKKYTSSLKGIDISTQELKEFEEDSDVQQAGGNPYDDLKDLYD